MASERVVSERVTSERIVIHESHSSSQSSSQEHTVVKNLRPGLTFRDSAGSSIASRASTGGDRHDVVSDHSLLYFSSQQTFISL